MNLRKGGLVELITHSFHIANEVDVVVIGTDALTAARSFEELAADQLGACQSGRPIGVIIDRRGLVPRSLFNLSLMFRSPRWLADRIAATVGMIAGEHYLLWPTPYDPQFAFDRHNPRLSIRWARRAGVMGRPPSFGPASVLRRSPVYAEFVYRTSPIAMRLAPHSPFPGD